MANPGCLERHGLVPDDLVRVFARVGLVAEVWVCEGVPTRAEIGGILAGNASRLIVAGGDGTLHQVVNVLAASEHQMGSTGPSDATRVALGFLPPLGVLPLGTANDFARSVGLPLDLEKAARVAASDLVKVVDLGWVNGEFFLNAVHVGGLAGAVRHVRPWLKRSARGLAYGLVALTAAWRLKPFAATLEVAGVTQTAQVLHVTVANGCYFGGGVPIARRASIQDGFLDLLVVPPWELKRLALMLKCVLDGSGLMRAGTLHARAPALTLSFRQPVAVTVDGESSRLASHLNFQVFPQSLRIHGKSDDSLLHGAVGSVFPTDVACPDPWSHDRVTPPRNETPLH